MHRPFLPSHSPELQPAEHLRPLTNTALINRHFADLDALAGAQARRCIVLQRCRDLIRQEQAGSGDVHCRWRQYGGR